MNNKFTIALMAAVASLFNLSVGQGDLRVTLGIVVLIIALHTNKELEIMSTSLITGIAVFLTRVLVSAVVSQSIDMSLMVAYFIEIVFYLGYGFFYKNLVLNDKNEQGTSFMLLLILCDFGANVLEYLVRYGFYSHDLVQADFVSIFLAAFIRSALIWLLLKFVLVNQEMRTAV